MGCELEARKTVTAGEMNTTYGRRDVREGEREGGREGEREGGKREGKEKREREIHYFQQVRIDPVSECLLLHSLVLSCKGQRSFITHYIQFHSGDYKMYSKQFCYGTEHK